MDLEIRDLPLTLTNVRAASDGPPGFEGYAATFGGKPNSYNEIVVKGAFAESLRQRTPKFLWQHFMDKPIARTIEMIEDDYGLYGKWQLANTADAKNAYELIKEGLVEGLSIGFIAREVDWNEDGVRVIRKADVYEVSAVTIPSQEAATITAIRADVPFGVLLQRGEQALTTIAAEAKALHERRVAENRALNDRHREAIENYLRAVEAHAGELRALVVVEPEAKAPDFGEIGLQLAERRIRLGRHLTRESA